MDLCECFKVFWSYLGFGRKKSEEIRNLDGTFLLCKGFLDVFSNSTPDLMEYFKCHFLML
jgi:hypothetical protein